MRHRTNPISSQPSTETRAWSGQNRGCPYPIERNDSSSESNKEEEEPPPTVQQWFEKWARNDKFWATELGI